MLHFFDNAEFINDKYRPKLIQETKYVTSLILGRLGYLATWVSSA